MEMFCLMIFGFLFSWSVLFFDCLLYGILLGLFCLFGLFVELGVYVLVDWYFVILVGRVVFLLCVDCVFFRVFINLIGWSCLWGDFCVYDMYRGDV